MDGIFLVLALASAVSGPVAFLLALAARARRAVAERRIASLEAELRAAGLREVARLPGAPPSRRRLVETAMYRYKTIIGRRLHARIPSNQRTEAKVACNVLNRMTSLGMPISIRST
jgi:hypothetical protein